MLKREMVDKAEILYLRLDQASFLDNLVHHCCSFFFFFLMFCFQIIGLSFPCGPKCLRLHSKTDAMKAFFCIHPIRPQLIYHTHACPHTHKHTHNPTPSHLISAASPEHWLSGGHSHLASPGHWEKQTGITLLSTPGSLHLSVSQQSNR